MTGTGALSSGMYSHWWRPTVAPEPEYGFFLNDGWSGSANRVFQHGRFSDEILGGDWNGDGTDTLGIRRTP